MTTSGLSISICYTSYKYINNHTNRTTGGTFILIKNSIPHSQIHLNINLKAITVLATIYKAITLFLVYILQMITL